MIRTGLVADPLFARHDPGPFHPEAPDRFHAVLQAFETEGLLAQVRRIPIRPAEMPELRLCHGLEYLERARREIEQGETELSTGDTAVCRDSWEVALGAAGGVLQAVDAVMTGEIENAFCAVRPPGHHASPDRGMGFCIVNHIAIAARYAQRKYGIHRVLIADWDVHHGNGTQDIFYQDGTVFFFSTHQWPLYPGTGAAEAQGRGPGAGMTLNCPFPTGSGRKEVVGAFRNQLVPAMERFQPELVLVSAGFDSRIGDPLGNFRLTDDDFSELTVLLLELAGRYAGGRMVSALEGGYNLEGLASAATAHLRALIS